MYPIPALSAIFHRNKLILAGKCPAADITAVLPFTSGKGYMGKKDIVDRPYFSDRQRFAELVNAAIYHGENVLLPGSLTPLRRKYPSLASGSGELERDVLMKDTAHNICYGIEIETESDYGMPQRVITYDACDYEYQMKEIDRGHRARKDYRNFREKKSRMRESDFLLPTITIVLYLGEGHWQGRRKLSQMFRLPAASRDLLGANLQDYCFSLVEADYVDPAHYRTDLCNFFQAMQCRGDRDKLKSLFRTEAFRHLDTDTEHAIAGHLHIERLLYKMEKEELPMCLAFDELEKELREEGRKEGKREGKREGKKEGLKEGKIAGRKEERIQIVRQMIKENLDEALIRKITECSKEEYAIAAK